MSPSNYEEFDRLLKPGGRVIKVIPGEDYLKELRALQPGRQAGSHSNKEVKRQIQGGIIRPHSGNMRCVTRFELTDEEVSGFPQHDAARAGTSMQ
ncbi:MAG: hypothetical protein U5K84_11455 [Alkalibacterium sp.]|nr:hypothetical protein [Alkalibacterium sp.]